MTSLKRGMGSRSHQIHGGARDRRVLEPDAREIGDCDLISARASRLLSCHDLPQLGVNVVTREQPGIDCVSQLAECRALRETVDDHEIRAIEAGGREFLLAW